MNTQWKLLLALVPMVGLMPLPASAAGFDPTAWGEQWKAAMFELRFNLERDENMVLDIKYAEILCQGVGLKRNLTADDISPVVHPLWYHIGRSKKGDIGAKLQGDKPFHEAGKLKDHEFVTLYKDPDYGTVLTTRFDLGDEPDLVKQINDHALKVCKGEKVDYDDPYAPYKKK